MVCESRVAYCDSPGVTEAKLGSSVLVGERLGDED